MISWHSVCRCEYTICTARPTAQRPWRTPPCWLFSGPPPTPFWTPPGSWWSPPAPSSAWVRGNSRLGWGQVNRGGVRAVCTEAWSQWRNHSPFSPSWLCRMRLMVPYDVPWALARSWMLTRRSSATAEASEAIKLAVFCLVNPLRSSVFFPILTRFKIS